MTDQEYIERRVDDQIEWYDKKSTRNRYWYNTLKVLEILLALLIPLFAGLLTDATGYFKYVVGVLGFLVAAITGIINLFKFHEKWTEYRVMAETLRRERYLYLTRAGIYGGDQAYSRFVERVEGQLAEENMDWSRYMKEEGEGEKD
jgi:hypothetical protein